MTDSLQETPQAVSAPSPTTVAAHAVAPIPNGTPAEDVEMADPTPAPATEHPVPVETPTIAPEFAPAPAPTSEPQVQPPPVQQQQPVQPALSAPSSRNSPHPSGPAQMPVHATLHGAPTRQYLNQHVTPHLLEAMKHLVTEEPEKPLEYLSKWLAQKSAELEG
ncbi:hypothetical protein P171DRAFT_364703 [Karstenula rhodostoma CBS 690.94]|uniref:Uncharacterized protein n=1 Tax=Karstenula rhodostoma CBS 690.94 TaxID=1392251 RepID=A0A9P4UAR5_9PLEO|nr:hypothetical protein P171DRAFT_364703 [Karstenula rhodostoma CBS 690.94]